MNVDQGEGEDEDWMRQTGDSPRATALLPDGVRAELPGLYSGEHEDDPMVVVKLFTPMGGWSWFVVEGGTSPATGRYTLFALVHGFDDELGYVDLEELASVRGPAGMPMVERDLYWRPRRLSEVQRALGAGRRP